MSDLSDEDIRHLALLARISISDDDVVMFREQLGSILDYVAQLDSVDTTGLAPTSQVTGLTNVQRGDGEETDTLPREKLLEQTPEQDNGQIKVRRVL